MRLELLQCAACCAGRGRARRRCCCSSAWLRVARASGAGHGGGGRQLGAAEPAAARGHGATAPAVDGATAASAPRRRGRGHASRNAGAATPVDDRSGGRRRVYAAWPSGARPVVQAVGGSLVRVKALTRCAALRLCSSVRPSRCWTSRPAGRVGAKAWRASRRRCDLRVHLCPWRCRPRARTRAPRRVALTAC